MAPTRQCSSANFYTRNYRDTYIELYRMKDRIKFLYAHHTIVYMNARRFNKRCKRHPPSDESHPQFVNVTIFQ